MSAFVVPVSHITALVDFLVEELDLYSWSARKIGQTLLDENCLSVAYRYSEPAQRIRFGYRRSAKRKVLPPVQIVKAVNCLNYQSCEHPGWEESQAFRILVNIRHIALGQIPSAGYSTTDSNLPGYDGAEWVID